MRPSSSIKYQLCFTFLSFLCDTMKSPLLKAYLMQKQPNVLNKIARFLNDTEYYQQIFRIALPIMLQNFLMACLSLINNLMIGQLGEETVAAVGLGNQVFFLLDLISFGVMSGSAVFTAQLWGKRDLHNIRRVLGFGLKLGTLLALIFFLVTFFFPEQVMRFYTDDPEVIRLGSEFLRIQSWMYPLFAIAINYYGTTRSTGNVRTPMLCIIITLAVDTLLAYIFIFGKLGLSPMAHRGAALSIVLARLLEVILILTLTYRNPDNPAAARLSHIFDFDPRFMKVIMKPIFQVTLNEAVWSFGVTAYNAIYAHISTSSIAAINIVGPIEHISFVVFFGIGNATAIIVGNLIGQGEEEKAYLYSGRSLVIQSAGAGVMGGIAYLFSMWIFQLYHVSPEVIYLAHRIVMIMAWVMWLRACNHIIIIGILRSGGDTRYSLFMELLAVWTVGVPMAAFSAFVLHLPVYWVYVFALSEEMIKFLIGLRRYFSRKWICNMTSMVEIVSPLE